MSGRLAEEPATCSVHRCRFVDFTPSAITAIAFPPFPLPSIKTNAPVKQFIQFGILAVGHANGNIDLSEWTGTQPLRPAPQAWVVRRTLSGPYPSKVDSLAFAIRNPQDIRAEEVPTCSDLRLFSSGGGSELIEWHVEQGCVRRTISSQGGSIWSISVNPASTILAIGCEDGSVRLLSLLHDTLNHHKKFDRVKCRVLSIAWGPPVPCHADKAKDIEGNESSDDDEDDWRDSWLVTGGSDSSLRKWDVSTGRVLDRMGTDKVRGERTLVWAVGVLGDGTIVSGDSLGMVKFWDPRTCTQLQSFQGHAADVLCLTISPDGTVVYTSGVDQKVSQFSFVRPSNSTSALHSSSRWVQSVSRRLHVHDVRSIAIWPPHTPLPLSYKRQFPVDVAPILVSGGLDMSVVITPAALSSSTTTRKVINPIATSTVPTFEEAYQRRVAYTSGPSSTSAIRVARQARLVSCMHDTSVSIWKILAKNDPEDGMGLYEDEGRGGGWEKMLEMEFNVHTNLLASAISDDGRWLVVSDAYETKLFALNGGANTESALKPRRIKDFSSILQVHLPKSTGTTGGSSLGFTPDSSKLVMTTAMSSFVLIIELNDEKPQVLRRFDQHRNRSMLVHNRVMKGLPNGKDVTTAEPDEELAEDTLLANIMRMAISPDGQWLVTSDDRCRTHVFNIDSVQHHAVLPSFRLPVQALAFGPSLPNALILAFPDNTLQIYDVEQRQFPAWGKLACRSHTSQISKIHDPIMGVTFDPMPVAEAPRAALLWGSSWMCKLPLESSRNVGEYRPKRTRAARQTHTAPTGDSSSSMFPTELSMGDVQTTQKVKMIMHYRPILFVDFLCAGELVVVERPLVDVLAGLPPAFFKHKYGAS